MFGFKKPQEEKPSQAKSKTKPQSPKKAKAKKPVPQPKEKEIVRVLTKRDTVERIAKKLRMTQNNVEEVYDEIVGFTLNELSKVGAVRISGLGTFRRKMRKERKAYNPYTKENITVPSRPYIRFVPGVDVINAIR